MAVVLVKTNAWRQKKIDNWKNGIPLPQPTKIAFGDGGHNPDSSLKPLDPEATALVHQLGEMKNIAEEIDELEFTRTIIAKLDPNELNGETLSELALIGDDGTIIGFMNFGPNVKGPENYQVKIHLKE